jgi:hypothetical protein
MCRTAVDFMLNECLTVMVSRPDISLKTLLNIGNPQKDLNEIETAGDARPKTASPLHDINSMARYLSLTKLFLEQLRFLPLLSVVVSITALVLSSSLILRMLLKSVNVASTRSYSS